VPKSNANKQKRAQFTRRNSDRHVLYQLSVQDPDFEVGFVARTFRKLRNRDALSLREDFCGTALFAGTWVKKRSERTALGVDIDQDVLDWGIEHNLRPIGEPGNRLKLSCANVLDPVSTRFDICCAFNFSYWIFEERPLMLQYFKGVHRCLARDGLFFLDAYGGYESHQPDLEEPRKIDEGFTYIWHQDEVDPITNHILNHIHFHVRDGSKWRKAFSYSWRFWSLKEIRELLLEAGFRHVEVYWEGAGEDGTGNCIYRPRKSVKNEASWVAYLVAEV
jgi:SAM-dependent methyltransferase